MAWPEYEAVSLGSARIMDESSLTEGDTASLIMNFWMTTTGNLESRFRIMPLIPGKWNEAGTSTTSKSVLPKQPTPFTTGDGVLAMKFAYFDGGSKPEILFITTTGIYRYAPWLRNNSAGSGINGLEEIKYYPAQGAASTILPQGKTRYPPQIEQVGNRMYFTFCDGGRAWVWDGNRLRPFGYSSVPIPPDTRGPARGDSVNTGGFSVHGSIGTIDGSVGEGGASLDGEWQYAQVWENVDGAYSKTSPGGGICTMRLHRAPADDEDALEAYTRKFYVRNLHIGPPGTVARILLRSKNRMFLPPGDDGQFRFLHRIQNNVATEYIDDIHDGSLGPHWKNREETPFGFYFLRSFGGSLFVARTDGDPSRVWWSEQDISGAHPESIMEGHWRDVFPETGPITALAQSRPPTGGDSPFLLVLKDGAAHAVSGQYPNWAVGTLHLSAGCAGPNLIQSIPDGSVIWYGARTFWRFDPQEGSVRDVGTPIKQRLRRVNFGKSHMGSSAIDRRTGEVVFALPFDDGEEADLRFVWDYRVNGWRLKDGIEIKCMLDIPGYELVLAAGTYAGVQTVWCLDRGYPGYETVHPGWEYSSGWSPTGELHNIYNIREAILTLEERHSGTMELEAYKDWDQDNAVNTETVTLAHPENDNIAYYGLAVYNVDVYRDARTYSSRLALDVASEEVVRLRVFGSNTVSLLAIHGYGPPVALPGGRTPQ